MGSIDLFILMFNGVFLWMILGSIATLVFRVSNRVLTFLLKWAIVNVMLPIFIFSTTVGFIKREDLGDIHLFVISAPLFVALGYFISIVTTLKFRPSATRTSFHLANSFHNYGFIAYPLVGSIYGQVALAKLFVHVFCVELLVWTFGVSLLTKGWVEKLKHVVNLPALSLLLSFASVMWYPVDLKSTSIWPAIDIVRMITVPFSLMLMSGVLFNTIKEIPLRVWVQIDVGVALFLRHVINPVILLTIFLLCFQVSDFRNCMVIQSIMPAAMLPMTIGAIYGGDLRFLGATIGISNLLSAITIPVWLTFLL